MACLHCSHSSLLLTILLFLFSSTAITDEIPELDLANRKTTHIRFYLHNIVNGPNTTAIQIVRGPVPLNLLNFGETVAFDDALTEGPTLNTTLVGRAQGIYVRTSLSEVAIFIAMNILFTSGEYNGSTLAVLTRNPFLQHQRELSVVGGTGKFRMAQGYIISNTYKLNFTTRSSINVYDVYVVHYW